MSIRHLSRDPIAQHAAAIRAEQPRTAKPVPASLVDKLEGLLRATSYAVEVARKDEDRLYGSYDYVRLTNAAFDVFECTELYELFLDACSEVGIKCDGSKVLTLESRGTEA